MILSMIKILLFPKKSRYLKVKAISKKTQNNKIIKKSIISTRTQTQIKI